MRRCMCGVGATQVEGSWESMPMQSRSQNELINMVAGAEPEAFNNTGRGASVNGTRSGTGNYLVEGADNNEQGQGGVALMGPGGANTTRNSSPLSS